MKSKLLMEDTTDRVSFKKSTQDGLGSSFGQICLVSASCFHTKSINVSFNDLLFIEI